jgi:hypothetical protein
MKNCVQIAVAVATAVVLSGAQPSLRADSKSSVDAIRHELLQLPYYGVFDFLAFSYDKGTVTLMGYAYHGTLKDDATRAAKRASGVDQVIDKVEELPVSQNDDDLRWKTYYAIYRDPFRRDAPGGGVLAIGTRSTTAFTRWVFGASQGWSRLATTPFTSS